MKTAQIFADTVGKARCTGQTCGAQITWATLVKSGKKMCFDGEIVALRTLSPTEHPSGRAVWEVDLDTNHWATCSDRAAFRRT